MRMENRRRGFSAVEAVVVLAIVLLLAVVIITMFRSAVDAAREMEARSVLRLCQLAATGCYTELAAENAFSAGTEVVLAYPPWYDGEALPAYMRQFAQRFEGYLGEDVDHDKISLTLTVPQGEDAPYLLIRYYPDGRESGAYFLWDNGTITREAVH